MSTRSTRRRRYTARYLATLLVVGLVGSWLMHLIVRDWGLDHWRETFVCVLGTWVLLDLVESVGLL